MPVSDRELVAAALGGDQLAFAELARRHRGMVVAACRRAVGHHGLAEDAAQEATVVAWMALARLRNPDRFGSWLVGIALNMTRGWLRYEARCAWAAEALAGGRTVHTAELERGDPADLLEYRELVATLRRAVEALPAGQRDAVINFYLRGLTQAEVAAALGTSVGAIKTRLHKARRNLRDRLLHVVKEELMAERTTVRMQVSSVCQLPPTDSGISRYVVVLSEVGGDRRLPIWVGEHEGIALAFATERAELPRPMTHALTVSLLDASDAEVRAVTVTQLVEATYYATVTLETSQGERHVDARPSDGLTLAALAGADIRVDEAMLDEVVAHHGGSGLPDAEQVESQARARAPEIVAGRLAWMDQVLKEAKKLTR